MKKNREELLAEELGVNSGDEIAPAVNIGLCKCKEGHRMFGVRFERNGTGWKYTWAFPIKKEASAQREGYGSYVLKGALERGTEYPGCPYCGSLAFIVCECGRLNCNNGETGSFTCEWCGLTGTIGSYDGEGFTSGEDR